MLSQDTDCFHVACADLLRRVLKNAGLVDSQRPPESDRTPRMLLDLGYGCGDQSIYLTSCVGMKKRDKPDKYWSDSQRVDRSESFTL